MKKSPKVKNQIAAAERNYESATAELARVSVPFRDAQAEVKQATKALEALKDRIEDNQPQNSSFSQTKAAYLQALQAYQELNEQANNSPEYQQAYRAAQSQSEVSVRAQAMADVRRRFITENEQLQQAYAQLRPIKAAFEKQRFALFQDSADYDAYCANLQSAKEQEDEANLLVKAAAGNRLSASSRRSAANKTLSSLTTTRAQAQAAIRQLDVVKRSIGNKRKKSKR